MLDSIAPVMQLLLILSFVASLVSATPLDDYVNQPDPTFEYRDLGNPWKGDGYTSYFINLTSQLWLSREKRSAPFCMILEGIAAFRGKIMRLAPRALFSYNCVHFAT